MFQTRVHTSERILLQREDSVYSRPSTAAAAAAAVCEFLLA